VWLWIVDCSAFGFVAKFETKCLHTRVLLVEILDLPFRFCIIGFNGWPDPTDLEGSIVKLTQVIA